MHFHDYISQNKDSSRLCTILDYHPPKICCRHCYKILCTSQLTPQAQKKLTPQTDQEPRQYRSGHNWYSKLIMLEDKHRLLKF